MQKPMFMLLNGYIPFVFVVPPINLRVDHGQGMEPIDIIDVGEIYITGKRKSKRISFGGFFPALTSKHYSTENPLIPILAVQTLEKWKDEGTELKLIVLPHGHYLKCKIENLEYKHKEHTGDIYYTLNLVEASEDLNVINAVSGLFMR